MKTMKMLFLPLMMFSSVFWLNFAMADSHLESRGQHRSAEAREDARDGMQEVKQGGKQVWQDVKEGSKEVWSDTKSAFSEGVLEGKLGMAIALNKHLDSFDIDVDVKDDRAVLEGKVSSSVEKDLAESIAKGIEGIASVDNRLIVDSSLAVKHHANAADNDKADRNFSQFFADVSTTASIKAELLANDNIKGLDVKVDTYNNRVTLTGEVKTEVQKSLAESIAKKRDDVTEVVNNIRVNS
jgi:hyperosmotically inducible protein